MHILVTGSEGLIGRELVSRLSRSNYKITCLDLKKKNFIKNKNIFFLKKDLLKKNELFNSLKNKKINIVIHLAAFLGVKKTQRFELECLETNIMSTRNLLDICKKLNIKKIIFSSSSEVYGNLYKRPMKEDDPLSPVSAYGISKVCCETYIKAYAKKKIINYNIVRFFNIYGKNQKKDFVIPKFADLITKNKKIEIYGSGNQIRSYCHVNDAVSALIKVIKKGKKNTTYNIGNNIEPTNLKNLVRFFEKLTKKKIKKKYIPFEKSDRSFQREVFFRVPNIQKITKDTNYKPKIKLFDGLKQIINKKQKQNNF